MRSQGSIDKLELDQHPFTVSAHLVMYLFPLPKSNILELSIVCVDAHVIEEALIVQLISVPQFQIQPCVPRCVPVE